MCACGHTRDEEVAGRGRRGEASCKYEVENYWQLLASNWNVWKSLSKPLSESCG